ARRTVVVCDSSKFGRRSLSLIVPPTEVQQTITDSRIPKSDLQFLGEAGVEVTLVWAGLFTNAPWRDGRARMTSMTETPGRRTLSEILSQPRSWRECLNALDRQIPAVREKFQSSAEALFVGCGSSFYVAQAAESCWTHLTGQKARAAPASELLLYPELLAPKPNACRPVLISRSGATSEILKAAEWL